MSGQENQRPFSVMARKFLMASEGVPIRVPDPNDPCYAFRKEPHFFYGTLMDAATLAKVLGRPDQPVLRPAKVIGYQCMMWGPYPALALAFQAGHICKYEGSGGTDSRM